MNKQRRKGLILRADDMEVGQLVTIHHWQDRRPLGLGDVFQVKAIALPYLVAQPLGDPDYRPVTFDIRMVRLMKLGQEYAEAMKVIPTNPTVVASSGEQPVEQNMPAPCGSDAENSK